MEEGLPVSVMAFRHKRIAAIQTETVFRLGRGIYSRCLSQSSKSHSHFNPQKISGWEEGLVPACNETLNQQGYEQRV
jgi:hypothetical protein